MDYLNPDFVKYQQAEKLQRAALYRLGQQVLKTHPNRPGILTKILSSINLQASGTGLVNNNVSLKQTKYKEA